MRIFLSYSRSDLAQAEPITANLKQAGHEVFFDQHNIKAAEDFNRIIWEQIQKADLFIYLISPNSVSAGSYTLTELALAEKKWPNPEQRVLPIIIESTDFADIPIYASICNIVQPSGNIPARVRAEVNSLNKHHRRAKIKRAAVIIAVSAMIAMLMVLGYREYLDRGPIAARTKLGMMNIAFDQQTFVDRASSGDLHAIKLFLSAGMDPNAVSNDRNGNTALMKAIIGDHFGVVSELIKVKVNVNAEDNSGYKALGKAARLGRKGTVSALLDAGADADSVNAAFVSAAQNGHAGILRLLMPREVEQKVIDNAFIGAAGIGDREIIELLLEKVSDQPKVASKALLWAAESFGRHNKLTAEQLIETFNFLLELGASVDVRSEDGFRPLFHVLRISNGKGAPELVEFLLQKGADPDIHCECRNRFSGGWTPLTLAIKVHGHANKVSPIDMLLVNGADVNLATKDGRTPLMLAAKDGNQQLVQKLLKKGASINDRSESGNTALYFAVGYDRVNVVTILLNNGADIKISNNPLRMAVDNDNFRIVEILLEKGADVNESTSKGNTALMLAAKKGSADIVQVLLSAGARTADKDKERGRTAEVFAQRFSKNSEVIKLLQDAAKLQ